MTKETLNGLFKRKGVSIVDVAEFLGISKVSVFLWLKGRNCPGEQYIELLAKLLDCTPYEVFLAWVRTRIKASGWIKTKGGK